MQPLTDFMHTPAGRDFLHANGVFTDPNSFQVQLQPPRQPELARDLNAGSKKLICSGQQIYVDYRRSVLSKIEVLQELTQNGDAAGLFLWVDTDRAGSDNLITKFAWPNFSKKGPITIMPPRARQTEMRFVEVDNEVLASAVDKLETYLRQYAKPQKGAKDRFMRFRSIFVEENHRTLSRFNGRLTEFLLDGVYGYTPPALMLSDQLEREGIVAEIELFINHLPRVIEVFNQTIDQLTQQGLDPQVTPLDEHYFPLFYSCPQDDQRLRLYHTTEGDDHFAIGKCNCGELYKFHLGRQPLSIAKIVETGRWSPDVCFPIFFNDRVSGYVAGKSSGAYLIVLNAVMQQVLHKTPAPVLIPPALHHNGESPDEPDSLIYRYMAGQADGQ